ncbi:unnamed protein product [Musa banksii]
MRSPKGRWRASTRTTNFSRCLSTPSPPARRSSSSASPVPSLLPAGDLSLSPHIHPHVPGFIENAEELKSKGVDEILLISVNDPFVMKAWAKTYPENKNVKFLADGSGTYTHALGLELDLSEKGLGTRSRRFALLADDLVVKVANIEEGGAFTISGAEEILKAL